MQKTVTATKCIYSLQDYNVVIKPVLVMPASLLLIEDYVKENKLKGLKCCSSILKCLVCKYSSNMLMHG